MAIDKKLCYWWNFDLSTWPLRCGKNELWAWTLLSQNSEYWWKDPYVIQCLLFFLPVYKSVFGLFYTCTQNLQCFLNSIESIGTSWIEMRRKIEKYGGRITKPIVNAFFWGTFISFLLYEFYNHNVIKWNPTSKNIMLTWSFI